MDAGITATLITDKVLGLLSSNETSAFRGVLDPELVERLKTGMKRVQTEIENIGAWDDEVAQVWLNQAADVVQPLELVIDTCLLRAAQRQYQPDFIVKLVSGRSLASQMEEIIAELGRIKDLPVINYQVYLQRQFRSSNVPDDSMASSLFIEESEVVGIDSEKEKLQSVVVGELPPTRMVISLVGIGGVGKTTLAGIIYRDEMVEKHFDCKAWIEVSKSYDFEKVLRDLTTQICSAAGDFIGREVETLTLQELSHPLKQHLLTKRYLIVFDDVWGTEFWEYMNDLFQNNNNGSRIIITTRYNAIADSCDFVQNLQPLSKDKAFQLFCKKAFGFEFEGNCPPELEQLSLELVRRCHGLPLVINTVAGFLSTKNKVLFEWQTMLDNFSVVFETVPPLSRVQSIILSCSYDDLPFHIRACLLYFGVFPEGFLVPDLKLYKFWIAEGFVKGETGKTLEEVAANYLNELINRNLVQFSYLNYCGMERMCRVTGFIRDIILSKAKDFGIWQNTNKGSSRRNIRRLSICDDSKNIMETIEISMVRSVLLFKVNEPMNLPFMVNLFQRFRLLELLDFENADLDYLPNEVGNLFLLKYLSLRNTKVKKLPKSIGLLLNLQTLDVRNTLIRDLPMQILKLQNLRHLLANAHYNNSIYGVKIKGGIGLLENLQTLLTVEAHRSGFGVIKELEKLRRLRCLSISKLTTVIVNSLCTSIEKMNHLESLSLYSSNGYEIFDFESISSPPLSLRRLILTCQIERLPGWICMLQNLSVLCLSFSRLAEPLIAIHDLPNLVSLWLHQAYIGEQLHFQEASFRKLKQLVLTELSDLRMMRIEKGALPLLEELRIGPSSDEFSSDIQYLRNLQILEYYDMPHEFVLHLQPGESDYWRIEHVPSVVFRYRIRGRRYVSYKLGDSSLLDHVKGLNRTTYIEWYDRPLSFFYKDDEELATTLSARWSEQRSFFYDDDEDLGTTSSARWSEQRSFFSDDVED